MGRKIKIYFLTGLLLTGLILQLSCDKTATPPPVDESVYDIGHVVTEPLINEGISDIWWQNWPAWTHNDSMSSILTIQADAVTNVPGFRDEGIGRFARERSYTGSPMNETMQEGKIRGTAWLESFGETRVYAMGLKKLEDKTFEQDANLKGPRVFSSFWDWSRTGLGIQGSEVNFVAWAGVDAYVNELPWLGGMSARAEGIPDPTYPDGTLALGYFDDEIGNPLKAKMYDANCAKDINGRFDRPEQLMDTLSMQGNNSNGFLEVEVRDGTTRFFGDLNFGKDVASPWWIHYARSAVRDLLKAGVSGFWVDNYEGWDTWNRQSVARAFGDWSEYMFREYLDQFPQICEEAGIKDTSTFEITDYLKDKFLEFVPGGDPENIWSSGWNDNNWMDEPIWRAYKVFKSELLTKKLKELHLMIKEEAEKMGLNPDDIVVSGNAGPFSMPDHMNEQVFDIASVEHSSILTHNPIGLAPNGGAGPIFSLLNHIQKGPGQSVIWYYANGQDNSYISKTNIGKIAGYECVAHNVVLNTGENDNRQIGTASSSVDVNRTTKAIRKFFGTRQEKAEIGVVYSMASEFSQAMPGGYPKNLNIASTTGYTGWGLAFQHMNIPYTGIMEYTLKEKIDDIKLLILPGMRSISQKTIDQVLMPWLDKGNTLVVTEEYAGAVDDRFNLYALNSKSILVDLSKNYKGQGKVIYYEKDLGQAYNLFHLISEDLKDDRKEIKKLIDSLRVEGRLSEELKLEGFSNVMTVVNENKEGKRLFVDLVNYDYSIETDSYNQSQEGTVLYKLPTGYDDSSLKLRVSVFDEKEKNFIVSEFSLENGILKVKLPPFKSYSTIMIERAK